MPLSTRRSRRSSIDIWPGFVDALAQLLMVIIFVLLVFTAGQFYLSAALSGRDKALKELEQQVSELSDLLALERRSNEELRTGSATLSEQLKATQAERDALTSRVAELESLRRDIEVLKAVRADLEKQVAALASSQQKSVQDAGTLTAAVAELRQQLAKIAAALDISEGKVKEQQGQIADLGRRLNVALATKVQELARYRSEFFGRLREIIGDRPDIRIVGDRFVFQSEVLFPQGSAELGDTAKQQLEPVIAALKQIAAKIPTDIN